MLILIVIVMHITLNNMLVFIFICYNKTKYFLVQNHFSKVRVYQTFVNYCLRQRIYGHFNTC